MTSAKYPELKDITQNDLYRFALPVKSQNDYLIIFNKFDSTHKKLNSKFNIGAFIFTGYWLLNRKMYGWFALLAISMLPIRAISPNLTKIPIVNSELISMMLVPFFLNIFFAIYADSLYHQKIKKMITSSQMIIEDTAKLATYLEKRGRPLSETTSFIVSLLLSGLVGPITFFILKIASLLLSNNP